MLFISDFTMDSLNHTREFIKSQVELSDDEDKNPHGCMFTHEVREHFQNATLVEFDIAFVRLYNSISEEDRPSFYRRFARSLVGKLSKHLDKTRPIIICGTKAGGGAAVYVTERIDKEYFVSLYLVSPDVPETFNTKLILIESQLSWTFSEMSYDPNADPDEWKKPIADAMPDKYRHVNTLLLRTAYEYGPTGNFDEVSCTDIIYNTQHNVKELQSK